MALQVTGNITLDNGLVLNSLYCRTDVELSVDGNNIFAPASFWATKNDYLSNKTQVYPNFRTELELFAPYDRTTQGNDILRLSNEFMQIQIDAQGLSSTIIDL